VLPGVILWSTSLLVLVTVDIFMIVWQASLLAENRKRGSFEDGSAPLVHEVKMGP
jgi:hypothetical protein